MAKNARKLNWSFFKRGLKNIDRTRVCVGASTNNVQFTGLASVTNAARRLDILLEVRFIQQP